MLFSFHHNFTTSVRSVRTRSGCRCRVLHLVYKHTVSGKNGKKHLRRSCFRLSRNIFQPLISYQCFTKIIIWMSYIKLQSCFHSFHLSIELDTQLSHPLCSNCKMSICPMQKYRTLLLMSARKDKRRMHNFPARMSMGFVACARGESTKHIIEAERDALEKVHSFVSSKTTKMNSADAPRGPPMAASLRHEPP